MTTPTRQEIQAAYKALDRLRDAASDGLPLNKFALESVMNDIHTVLPTIPRPTMADVVWNDEEHFLAEAKIKNGPLVAMIGESRDQWIICIPIETDPSLLCKRTEFEGYLTPTGRHYRLQEVQDV